MALNVLSCLLFCFSFPSTVQGGKASFETRVPRLIRSDNSSILVVAIFLVAELLNSFYVVFKSKP